MIQDPRCTSGVPPLPPGSAPLFHQKGSSRWYPALNTLPASPAAMRAALYTAAARGGAYWGLPFSKDQVVYELIARLLAQPISGAQRAALYEVIAHVPGVTLVQNAIDAAGRHGTGVEIRLTLPGYGLSTIEVILAPRTYSLLGETEDMPGQDVHFANLGSGLVTLPRS